MFPSECIFLIAHSCAFEDLTNLVVFFFFFFPQSGPAFKGELEMSSLLLLLDRAVFQEGKIKLSEATKCLA